MMVWMKRKWFLYMFLILAVSLAAARPAAAKTKQGKCGAKAKWSYDVKTKTVTISGKGAVTEMIRLKTRVSKVKKIVVKEGITNLKSLTICIEDVYSDKVNDDYKIQLILPDSLKKIGWIGSVRKSGEYTREFDMSHLTLTIPRNVNQIHSAALANIHPRKVVVDQKNKSFVCRDGVLYSKDKKKLVYYPIGKKQKTYKLLSSVRKIEPLAFYGNQRIEKVVLPKNLTEIGSGAFCGCKKLSSVNLEQTKIKKLTDYKGISYSHGWQEIDEWLLIDPEDVSVLSRDEYPSEKALWSYYYCGTFEGTNLTSVKLPDSLVYASSDTFLPDYEHAKSVRAPITLHLGKHFTGEINADTKGYQGKKSLCLSGMPVASVTVDPANTRYCVKNNALYSKDGKMLYQHFVSDNRKTYVIDAGTKQIAPGAFSWGDSMEDLIVEGSLDTIGYCAFSDFHLYPDKSVYGERKNALKSVSIQGSVNRIDAMAFRHSRLVTFACAGEIHYIGQMAFEGCSFLTSIPLNRGLRIVGGYAFRNCTKLQFSFSDTLESIGRGAFESCEAVRELYIPDSVQRIQDYAFGGCRNIETASLPGRLLDVGWLGKGVFDSCRSLNTITFRREVK